MHTHEASRIAALPSTSRCPFALSGPIARSKRAASSGLKRLKQTTGSKKNELARLEQNRTGSTALSSSDHFLQTSYSPRKSADRAAMTNHDTSF